MTWMKLDDQILEHPKFIRAVRIGGSEAVHLWIGLRAWCAQALSDGFIPEDMIDEVRGPKRSRSKALDALVTVGLVERDPSGWRLHDYLEWSDSREEVLEARRKAALRQKTSRANRGGNGQRESRRDTGEASHRQSQRDSHSDCDVTGPSVTHPPRARYRNHTDTETTPQPPNPQGSGSGGRVRCPRDLELSEGQRGIAEQQGISTEAVEAMTAKFRGSWCDREGESRTLDQWRASLNTTVHRDGRAETLRLRREAAAEAARPAPRRSDGLDDVEGGFS